MATLQEIRARLQAAENKQGGQSAMSSDIYPHWNLEEGQSCTLRFLPDGNSKNTFFWVERAMIRLPFNGVKGEMDSKQVMVQVPCMEMWGETCPILTEVRTWFKDKSLEEMGRKYWKKRSYIMQGFVRQNPIADDATKAPENPIRRFIIGPQIFTLIKSALMDPELEELPTDYMRGLDFRITKSSKGGYADYNTSQWARKESALTELEQAAIDTHGLYDLGSFLPKKPGEVELRVIKEMFEASVDGQPYDADRWAQYFRPAGVQAPAGAAGSTPDVDEDSAGGRTAGRTANFGQMTTAAPRTAPAPAPAASTPAWEDDAGTAEAAAPVAAPAAKPAGQNAQDILAMIRNRQQAK